MGNVQTEVLRFCWVHHLILLLGRCYPVILMTQNLSYSGRWIFAKYHLSHSSSHPFVGKHTETDTFSRELRGADINIDNLHRSQPEFQARIFFQDFLSCHTHPGWPWTRAWFLIGSISGSDSVSQSSVTECLCLQELSAIVENLSHLSSCIYWTFGSF